MYEQWLCYAIKNNHISFSRNECINDCCLESFECTIYNITYTSLRIHLQSVVGFNFKYFIHNSVIFLFLFLFIIHFHFVSLISKSKSKIKLKIRCSINYNSARSQLKWRIDEIFFIESWDEKQLMIMLNIGYIVYTLHDACNIQLLKSKTIYSVFNFFQRILKMKWRMIWNDKDAERIA